MANSVFITGANRGIGLEFAKQYAADNWVVYASCREPKKARNLYKLSEKFSNIHIIKLDISSKSDIALLIKKMKKIPIDVLINNAGILDKQKISFQKLTEDDLVNSFIVNAVSPLLITRALLPNIKLGQLKTVVAISSVIASITENYADEWNHYPYKTSKAALNMLMSCFASESQFSDIKVLLLDPGWVKTDMGGKKAPINPYESVFGMRSVIQKSKTSRLFIDYRGQANTW